MRLHRHLTEVAEHDVDDTERMPLRPALGSTAEWDDDEVWDLYEKAVAVCGHAHRRYGRCQCPGEPHG